MKIHLISDTHLEMGGGTTMPSVCGDVCVAAGDIGLMDQPDRLAKFFNEIHQNFNDIIWVLGNHEFYHNDYDKVLRDADEFAKKEGIILLDREYNRMDIEIQGVKFWGSTLWTDGNNNDWFAHKKIDSGLNDYRIVTYKDSRLKFQDTYSFNQKTRDLINWDADIIITHHCPLLINHKHFPFGDITYGFCNTGLNAQIEESNIKYWLYGHTHDSRNVDANGTTVISNQHGYSSRYGNEDAGYDPRLIIEV